MSGELAFYGGEIRDGLLMAVVDQSDKLPEGVSIIFDWQPCFVDPWRGVAHFDGITIEADPIGCCAGMQSSRLMRASKSLCRPLRPRI